MHLNRFWAICSALSPTRDARYSGVYSSPIRGSGVKQPVLKVMGDGRKQQPDATGTGRRLASSGARGDRNRGKLSHGVTEVGWENLLLAARSVSTLPGVTAGPPTHVTCHLEVMLFMSGSSGAGGKHG